MREQVVSVQETISQRNLMIDELDNKLHTLQDSQLTDVHRLKAGMDKACQEKEDMAKKMATMAKEKGRLEEELADVKKKLKSGEEAMALRQQSTDRYRRTVELISLYHR